MSDLGGGGTARASNNGGARTGGPIPVAGGAQIRTPQMIMRDREAREQRRMEESRQAEEQQKRLQAEERRRSAERRAATVPGAAPRFSNTSSQYSPDVSAPQGAGFDSSSGDQRRSSRVAGEVAGANMLGDPTSRSGQEVPSRPTAQDYATGRARGPALSQQDQPRPAPATAGAPRRTPQPQHATRTQATTGGAQPSSSTRASTAATVPGDGQQRGTASSFPHAFERWETLSSHWEGLTSYWLHKLEQNTEEIRETVPNASTLNRQITDLSAAGANLFHAVVELQRLRASSERKFQRWFFETRADNERHREIQAGLERQLKVERQAREDVSRNTTDNSIAVENAKREVSEMRRELMISKDEARRAWEELGRRNQESLDTAQSLKEGRVTLVAGVQVVPYFGGPASRTGSDSQGQPRPVTRDGPTGYASTGLASQAAAAGMQSPGDEGEYYRHDAASPSNTDPFTDSGRQQLPAQSLAHGSYHPPSYQRGYDHDRTPTGTSAATVQTAVPASSSPYQQVTPSQYPATSSPAQQRKPQPSVTSTEAQRFYQPGGQGAQPQPTAPGASVPRTTATLPREEARSVGHGSYGGSNSEIGTEYALDGRGEVQYDERGQPIVFRHRGQQQTRSSASEEDFDTEEAVRREREQAAQFRGGLLPEAPSVPASSAAAMATYTPATAGGGGSSSEGAPDYEGEGYDDYQQYVPRHHHPTRLSDVLEEEEERSSRRTMD